MLSNVYKDELNPKPTDKQKALKELCDELIKSYPEIKWLTWEVLETPEKTVNKVILS